VWEKILETINSIFLPWCCLPFVHVVLLVVLCVLLSSYVYLSCYVCIAVFTLGAGLLYFRCRTAG